MFTDDLPRRALRRDSSAIDDRLLFGVVAAGLPVPLSIAVGKAYRTVTDAPEPGAAGTYVTYGAVSLFVVAAVYYSLSTTEREAVFRFERPGRDELAWTAVCFPLGTAAYLAGEALAGAAGFEMAGYEYGLSDPVTVGAVAFGAVLVAPLAEELLFRGLLLGTLLGRGVPPILAGVASILAFGAMHVVLLGVAGVVATMLWATFPTALRLRYNNVTGAWLLHLVNNLWGYFVVVALGIG